LAQAPQPQQHPAPQPPLGKPVGKPPVQKRGRFSRVALPLALLAPVLVVVIGVGAWLISSRTLPRGASVPGSIASGPLAQPDFGRVLEEEQGAITSAAGGSVSLPDGARVEFAAGAIDEDTEVRLMRSEAPSIPQKADLYTDVYYLGATTRPQFDGKSTLAIPYDPARLPAGVDEASLQIYALHDGTLLYPEHGRVDTETRLVFLDQADVNLLKLPEDYQSFGSASRATGPHSLAAQAVMQAQNPGQGTTGFVIGKAGRFGCTAGEKGEVYEAPGHAFKIIFSVKSTCDLAERVSSYLHTAYGSYNQEYKDLQGKAPLAQFTPDNRMKVYINPIGGGTNALYVFKSWNGYIDVDPNKALLPDTATAQAKEEKARFVMNDCYHELFHAVQNRYRNFLVGGVKARWWFEASAEAVARKLRGLTTRENVRELFTEYEQYALREPIQESSSISGDKLRAYVYSLAILYAEKQRPGYVRDVLHRRILTSSEEYYKTLLEDGSFQAGYPEFVKEIMLESLPEPQILLDGRVVEAEDYTHITRLSNDTLEAQVDDNKKLEQESERTQAHHFTVKARPLTMRIFTVRASALKQPRTVEIKLLEDGSPSANAWVFLVASNAAQGAQHPPVRLGAEGLQQPGLGGAYGNIWIAVFNKDAANTKTYDLSVTLKGQATDLCVFFPTGQGLVPSPINFPGLCSMSTPDKAIEYLSITEYETDAAARQYVDVFSKQGGEIATAEYGDNGYAYIFPAQGFGDSSFPGHGLMFARGRYVVEGVAGFDTSVDPPQPIPPDRLRATALHVDQQLAQLLGVAP
jgi:hypothetical protein